MRSSSRWRQRAVVGPALGCCLLSAGCSIISPVPVLELIKGVGAVASLALERADSEASNTVYHPHGRFSELCIAFNPQAEISDIVPALQASLRRHGVDSRVYEPMQQVGSCKVWLHYTATIDWDTRATNIAPRPYMTTASLTLRTADEQVLSSSHYAMADGMRTDKWSSTREKLDPVVTALVTGSENISFFSCPDAPPPENVRHAPPHC